MSEVARIIQMLKSDNFKELGVEFYSRLPGSKKIQVASAMVSWSQKSTWGIEEFADECILLLAKHGLSSDLMGKLRRRVVWHYTPMEIRFHLARNFIERMYFNSYVILEGGLASVRLRDKNRELVKYAVPVRDILCLYKDLSGRYGVKATGKIFGKSKNKAK